MNLIQRFSLTTRHGKKLSVVESCVRHFCGRDGVIKEEGDWFYSPEWWDPHDGGYTVSRATCAKGNGVVSVVAHPSSLPVSICEESIFKNL